MSQKIIDQARVLAEMIAESDELRRVRQAETDLANDPIAQDLISQFQSLRSKEAEAKQDGKELSSDEQARFDAVEKQVDNNATISAYLEAQGNFNGLMDSVNYLIMKGINGSVDGYACDTESGCGGCSGCGH